MMSDWDVSDASGSETGEDVGSWSLSSSDGEEPARPLAELRVAKRRGRPPKTPVVAASGAVANPQLQGSIDEPHQWRQLCRPIGCDLFKQCAEVMHRPPARCRSSMVRKVPGHIEGSRRFGNM